MSQSTGDHGATEAPHEADPVQGPIIIEGIGTLDMEGMVDWAEQFLAWENVPMGTWRPTSPPHLPILENRRCLAPAMLASTRSEVQASETQRRVNGNVQLTPRRTTQPSAALRLASGGLPLRTVDDALRFVEMQAQTRDTTSMQIPRDGIQLRGNHSNHHRAIPRLPPPQPDPLRLQGAVHSSFVPGHLEHTGGLVPTATVSRVVLTGSYHVNDDRSTHLDQ